MKTDPPSPKRPNGKVFDVMRPGKAPASASSRPLIASHKPEIKDPSVTINGVGEARQLMDSRKKVQIEPVDAAAAASPIAAPQQPAAASAPVAMTLPDERAATVPPTQPVAAGPTLPSSQPAEEKTEEKQELALGEAALEGSDADHPGSDYPSLDAGDSAQSGIVISHHDPRSSHAGMAFLLISLIVLLAVIALNILLDAEILHWTGFPHTNFLR